jgi:hypothetical protein
MRHQELVSASRFPGVTASHRRPARLAVCSSGLSVGLMVLVGLLGPSAVVARVPPASGWPPWYVPVHPAVVTVSDLMWVSILLGGLGTGSALVALRGGWLPPARLLLAACVLGVAALTVVPPMGSADMLDYAVFGRIAATGHSPYVMTPGQLRASGDPIGKISVPGYRTQPSRYGPVATLTEALASELGRVSPGRTVFWLKVWNALAFIGLALLFHRLLGPDARRRARAHVLWSVNPLMLWAVMAGGHNDGIAAALGTSALLCMSAVKFRRALLAGLLCGLATAVKAPYALFGVSLAWTARRSPAALGALLLGAVAIVAPSYAMVGRAAVSASASVASMAPVGYVPWFAITRIAALHDLSARIDMLGLVGSVLLAAMLLWRIPPGPRDYPALRIALALALGWLVVSPQQRSWYDAMILPLLALMPASKLDWVVLVRAVAGAVAGLPRLVYPANLGRPWFPPLLRAATHGLVPLVLVLVVIALIWLCWTNDWVVSEAAIYPIRSRESKPAHG